MGQQENRQEVYILNETQWKGVQLLSSDMWIAHIHFCSHPYPVFLLEFLRVCCLMILTHDTLPKGEHFKPSRGGRVCPSCSSSHSSADEISRLFYHQWRFQSRNKAVFSNITIVLILSYFNSFHFPSWINRSSSNI